MFYASKAKRAVMGAFVMAWLLTLGTVAHAYDKKEFKEVFPTKEVPFIGEYEGSWTNEKIIPEAAAFVISHGKKEYRVIVTTHLDLRSPIQVDTVVKEKKGKLTIKEGDFYGEIDKKGNFTGGRGKKKTFTMTKVIRKSPYEYLSPPEGDDVDILYDGNGFDKWQDPTGWVEMGDGTMMVTPDGGYLITKEAYKDVTLHVEFRLSHMPKERGQGRSNSGVFISDEYEIQVLDSFGLEGVYNQCGALYKTSAPKVNATYPPLQWQTYDIYYKNAYKDEDGKIVNPRITVYHNGVLIHSDEELPWVPGHSAKDRAEQHHLEPGHIRLQCHGDFVQYRNIWVKGSVD